MRALHPVAIGLFGLFGAAFIAACTGTNPNTSSTVGTPRSGLEVSVGSQVPPEIAAIEINVTQNGTLIQSRTVSVTPSDDPQAPAADAFLVLQPGTYTVTAQALDANGAPDQSCVPASASAVVAESMTTEVPLTLICSGNNGGLDVPVSVVGGPIITGLTFDPSKFSIACEPVRIIVAASDSSDPAVNTNLSYSWAVVSGPTSPLDPSTVVSPQGRPFTTFYTKVPGNYTLRVAASDPNGTTSLSFPVHVSSGTACGSLVAVGPSQLPSPPPPVVGCYAYTLNGWLSIPCASEEFINSHFGHPDVQLTVSSSSPTPLVYGQVETTIPQVDSENNAWVYTGLSICPSSGSTAANQWSVQNNTNQWTVASGTMFNGQDVGGHLAATQFTIQSDGTETSICIWNVDVTGQNYSHMCTPQGAPQRSGGLQAFDEGNVAGFVNSNGTLSMVASFSWVPADTPTTYAVVSSDAFGLSGNWNEVSGGIIGVSNCSQAQFSNAEVVTQVAASTCAGDTDGTSPVCGPPLFQPNAGVFLGPTGTVETNNLVAIDSPAVDWPNSDLAVSNVIGTTSGSCLGPSHAYVKDNPFDFGATPSTIGDNVFWESPDIFLVPHGTVVDLNAVSTETLITPGGSFDVWVRVHNDFGCSDVTGVKALVYLADPSALSVEWSSITDMQFVGDNMSSTGVTVPAGGAALIGPLNFTAPTTGIGDGHKCLLAAIEGDGEAPPANTSDAPDSNQVAQRNLQFVGPCEYPLTNATTLNGNAQITLTVTPNTTAVPSLTALPAVSVTFDDPDSSWFDVWQTEMGNGSSFAVTHHSGPGTTTVRLGAFSVVLNAVPLAAGATRNVTGIITLPDGAPSVTLQIGTKLTGPQGAVLAQNGGSCVGTAPPIIK